MTITLRKTANGWTATSESYRKLFGTATIPTAFTAQASADMVLAEIQERNPGMRVEIA